MKVLAINGSPHEKGSTFTSINIAIAELEKQGIEVELVHIGDGPVQGCTGCGSCRNHPQKHCVFDDDLVNICLEKSKAVNGLIISSPVYYSGIAGTMKSFLDRFFFTGPNLKYKVGMALTVLRRSGGTPTFQQINNYFYLAGMVITPSQYWNVIHGTNPDEVIQDEEGVQIIQTAAGNMAWLIKLIENGKDSVPYPEPPRRVRTNFIH